MCDCILIFSTIMYLLSNSTVINIYISSYNHTKVINQFAIQDTRPIKFFFFFFYPSVLGITSFTSQHHLQRIIPGPKVCTDLNICMDTVVWIDDLLYTVRKSMLQGCRILQV